MDTAKTIGVEFTFYTNHSEIKERLDFPATTEDLRQMLVRAGVSSAPCGKMALIFEENGIALPSGTLTDLEFDNANVDSLNYLASFLTQLDGEDIDKLAAVIESGRHFAEKGGRNGEIADYINIIDNLDSFTFHADMDASGYGEYLLSGPDNKISDVIRLLRNYYAQEGEELGSYVECLRECADAEQFGNSMAYNNDGDFLESGYLIEDGGFHEAFQGIDDIPAGYRIWWEPDTFIKVVDVDLTTLLLEMHALGGNYTQDAAANLQALLGGDCFIVVNAEKLSAFPAADIFHMDSPYCSNFPSACNERARVFFAAVSKDNGSSEFRGSIHEIATDAIMQNVTHLAFDAVNIDAEFKDGTNRVFTPLEWSKMSDTEREQVAGMVYRYDSVCESQVANFITSLHEEALRNGREITQEEFLAVLNAPFMAKAQNAQTDMLRVAREAASTMLARSDSEVYRLTPEGAVKLTPLDAVKSRGLWFIEHREFAIKTDGIAGLDKWAKRTAEDIARQATRDVRGKSHGQEL